MRSIRRRVLLLVLGLLSVGLSVIALISYRDAQHEIEELFDAQLAQYARLLAGVVGRDMPAEARSALQAALDAAFALNEEAHAVEAEDAEAQRLGHEYESKLGFLVLDEAGQSVLQWASLPAGAIDQLLSDARRRPEGAAGAPDRTLNSHGIPDAPGTRSVMPLSTLADGLLGFHRLQVDGRGWRLFVLHDAADAHWIVVGERDDLRGELVTKVALRSLVPDLIGVPLLALMVWLAVGWGLRPLGLVAQRLKDRDPDNLAPLLLAPLPSELEPIVAALNRLLLQVTMLLEREKRFLADAAHELRTPLAVLRIHAQNALQTRDPADREEALRQLDAGVQRATRVVAQLLTLARLEPNAVQSRMQDCDLLALARNEVAELIPLALARGQDLTLEADEADEADAAAGKHDFHLPADAPSLAIMVQNLVGNAIRHAPDQGTIRVTLRAGRDGVELCVEDSGPGIPVALRDKVFERFFHQGPAHGAGLGLSIVARVVQLHGARIALGDSPLGGLRVSVRFAAGAASGAA